MNRTLVQADLNPDGSLTLWYCVPPPMGCVYRVTNRERYGTGPTAIYGWVRAPEQLAVQSRLARGTARLQVVLADLGSLR
jgi:hypothetical protein